MKRIACALFLSFALACAGSKPVSAPPAAPPTSTSGRLVSITSAEPVREVFNASSDRIRVVTLLSPT